MSVSHMLTVEAKGLLALLLTFSETVFFFPPKTEHARGCSVLFCSSVDNARGAVWMY